MTIILGEYGAINVDIVPYISGMVRGQSIFLRICERRNLLCQEEAITFVKEKMGDGRRDMPEILFLTIPIIMVPDMD